MKYRNRFDRTGECSEMGNEAEQLFTKIAESKFWIATKATRKEQLDHIDLFLENGKAQKHSIDVKARKKISRNDSSCTDDLLWVEFKNVAGNVGWLRGKAHYIAFEREKDFVIVRRQALLSLCSSLVDFKKVVDKSSDALYSIYKRKNRKDEISIIKFSDILENLSFVIWRKSDVSDATNN
jgi:hypothetical protein